jgi:hypothetical protein
MPKKVEAIQSKVGNVQRTVSAMSSMTWVRDLDSNLKKLSGRARKNNLW